MADPLTVVAAVGMAGNEEFRIGIVDLASKLATLTQNLRKDKSGLPVEILRLSEKAAMFSSILSRIPLTVLRADETAQSLSQCHEAADLLLVKFQDPDLRRPQDHEGSRRPFLAYAGHYTNNLDSLDVLERLNKELGFLDVRLRGKETDRNAQSHSEGEDRRKPLSVELETANTSRKRETSPSAKREGFNLSDFGRRFSWLHRGSSSGHAEGGEPVGADDLRPLEEDEKREWSWLSRQIGDIIERNPDNTKYGSSCYVSFVAHRIGNGRQPMRSKWRPTVLVSSNSPAYAAQLQTAIKRSRVLDETGFDIRIWNNPPTLT